ncbi:TPA: DNA mismatch endonuclease Vsr [Legionella pneumophila subsp. pneumophila]|uniref:Very short patch repair endonuclease n=2 Tax=Legionella pneumophila TaxID=446 RepID=Q5ZW52_LEGPH|nr:very short patch repair endonuclease [Legionella pneumophila]AAU27319.1 patch repair protein [Legionella pneumophila subsp. pneumophila str. Philadelphia 1]AGN14131.1 patch repair protein [Legionella pneumophila subsp. pneumophila str. Thunder Bay]PNL78396.1 very short patch repair endonuclease [Legionella pneumophila subsp. pneumophila]AOU10262.1 very short patch repair endonuclease [Legionella pneumophila]AOU13180.1 very short patch repair endonuclease [Legionella pneumophila]
MEGNFLDMISKKQRSHIMSSIKGKNTKPEIIVRSFLHRQGLRFRLHSKNLPGQPDLVFRKYNAVVFVNGCFWHGHNEPLCKNSHIPKTNFEYWWNKIERNKSRDKQNIEILKQLGWRVFMIWECELKNHCFLLKLLASIKSE